MEKITGISANQEIEDGEYFAQSHYLDIQDRIPDKGNVHVRVNYACL